jgi:hypothetical protein
LSFDVTANSNKFYGEGEVKERFIVFSLLLLQKTILGGGGGGLGGD